MRKLPEKLYLAEQVRKMDRIAIDDFGIAGIELMRRAGQEVFGLIQQKYPAYNITVFCGAGNNAGDGYVVAKLALQLDVELFVYFLSNPEKLEGDALIAYRDYIKAGGKIRPFDSNRVLNNSIVIDALLGTGLNREVSGRYAEAISLINSASCPVISVDIPSGLNANTGNLMGNAVKADYTVSFIGLKQGMFTGFAAEYCGNIIFSSLDIAEDIYQKVNHACRLISQCFLPKRHRCAHKGNNGHVLVVGGDIGFSGAISLAAEAALRVGAGLVSVATRKNHSSLINIARPELMCHGVEVPEQLLPLLSKATVIVIGPGLGQSQWGENMFDQVVTCKKPLVIDADGLNILATKTLQYDDWVLTPHPGEAARLLNCSTSDIANNRFSAVSQLQNKFGGVAVLKGAGTLIENGKETLVSTTGNPGMASGGMGDVLAGMIAGLIAQHLTLDIAASSAVHIHGKAADLCAQENGEKGLLASDLMVLIRKLVNSSKHGN